MSNNTVILGRAMATKVLEDSKRGGTQDMSILVRTAVASITACSGWYAKEARGHCRTLGGNNPLHKLSFARCAETVQSFGQTRAKFLHFETA